MLQSGFRRFLYLEATVQSESPEYPIAIVTVLDLRRTACIPRSHSPTILRLDACSLCKP